MQKLQCNQLNVRQNRQTFKSKRPRPTGLLYLEGETSDCFPCPGGNMQSSEITWNEATNTWNWNTVHAVSPLMSSPEIKNYIEDGWKVTRCFVDGVKAAPSELLRHIEKMLDNS